MGYIRHRTRLWAAAGLWAGVLLIAFDIYAAAVTYIPQYRVRNDFRLMYGAALTGLHHGYGELYDLLRNTLAGVAKAPVASLPAVTLAFQLQLAGELGYRPRLDACAVDGRPVSQRRLFSPLRGGLLCDTCAAREGGVIVLTAEALASFVLLLERPVGDAGEFIEIQRSGELLRVVEDFLRTHFQRFRGLRSLEVLKSLETPTESGGPPRA